jgi:hypothetical protein
MINIESNNQYSIITICKWDEYQIQEKKKVTTKEQPNNNQVTAEGQPKNTNNNDYNVYNDFYILEISKANGDGEYLKTVKALYGENNLGVPLKSVLKMETQLSYDQFCRIQSYKKKYSFSTIQLLESMENWGNPKKYKTVYGTFQTFLKRHLKIESL